MNKALNKLIESIRLIAEQMPCVLIADEDGRYAYVNQGWCDLLQYRPEEVIGKPVRDVVKNTKVDEVLKSGETALGYTVETPKGELLFNNCIPLRDSGKIIGVIILTFFTGIEEALGFSQKLSEMTKELERYKSELNELRGARYSLDEIIGRSPVIESMKKQIQQAARTSSTVLIEGETGCGKELVANAIHQLSLRSDKPFVKINCAAIPGELVESELFGYEKGAFSGADSRDKKGLFEEAEGGTLFLDEISAMAYAMQPKLLRALQEREIRHVGGSKMIPINARIVAATNKDLNLMVREERFREDLLYRLDVIHIYVPSLRERIADVPELADGLRVKLNKELGTYVEGISPSAEELLMAYEWPGNVRELHNVMERAINSRMSGVITEDDIKECLALRKRVYSTPSSLAQTKRNAEMNQIRECLLKNRYNKTQTAKDLGISRTLLYQKLKEYEIGY